MAGPEIEQVEGRAAPCRRVPAVEDHERLALVRPAVTTGVRRPREEDDEHDHQVSPPSGSRVARATAIDRSTIT